MAHLAVLQGEVFCDGEPMEAIELRWRAFTEHTIKVQVPIISATAQRRKKANNIAHNTRAGTSLRTCLYTQNIHKRQVHFQSLD